MSTFFFFFEKHNKCLLSTNYYNYQILYFNNRLKKENYILFKIFASIN